jgi:anti-sigma factor ChrR (cupin superfamily)
MYRTASGLNMASHLRKQVAPGENVAPQAVHNVAPHKTTSPGLDKVSTRALCAVQLGQAGPPMLASSRSFA